MGAFKNKRLNILLIMPSFYNISKVIENELLKRGHEVTFIENKILKEDYHLLKTVMSFIYFLLNPFYKTSYTNQILKKIHKKSFDLLFVVGHLSTNHNLFKHLKKLNLNIKTVLYLWDSFSVWDFSHLLEKFDYKYSFDRMDCKKHTSMNLVYFPLFYDFKDEQNNNIGYRLGRLFAVLEKAQEEASPGLNATIRDRYYGSASSSPVTAFSTLLKLSKHHIAKLHKGRAVNIERLIGEIMTEVQDFPAHLPVADQGRFAIGYYHQRQAFFTKSETKEMNHE